MKMELRVNESSMVTNDDGTLTVSGYVNKTNQYSEMLGRESRFKEVIKPGAWQRAIDKAKEIHFYAEHDKNKILSSTRNGSLELREDEQGLYMTATISPTSWGKDYYQLIKDGILQNMSFGFRAIKDSWRNLGDHFERTVSDLDLFEVSVVRDPAYASSSISARGIELVEDEVPAEERADEEPVYELRDVDLEALAGMLFEKISGMMNPTPVEEAPVDETPADPEPEVIEDPQPNPELEQVIDPDNDGDNDLDPAEDPDGDGVDVVVEETIDPPAPEEQTSAADKIRDFINQYK
jgi:HK97 family phage prohead protease